MKLQKILTIVDKPKHPQAALARTARLLHASGGAAHLAAFCWNAAFEAGRFLTSTQIREIRRSLIEDRRAWLEGEASRHRALEGAQRSVLWARSIADAVDELLAADPVDLVVKTLHQSKTLVHTPLDWELLRRSKVPVLLTMPKRRRQTGVILAAVDPQSTDRAHQRLNRRVLDAAASMAALEGSTMHVVAALELSPVLADLDIVDKRQVQRQARERTESVLQGLLKPYDIPRSRIHLPAEKVGQAVDQVARIIHADMVVVGTCAHPLKQAVGIGNSAERIVARVQCDVLAVGP